jgi:hypothetical protein
VLAFNDLATNLFDLFGEPVLLIRKYSKIALTCKHDAEILAEAFSVMSLKEELFGARDFLGA